EEVKNPLAASITGKVPKVKDANGNDVLSAGPSASAAATVVFQKVDNFVLAEVTSGAVLEAKGNVDVSTEIKQKLQSAAEATLAVPDASWNPAKGQTKKQFATAIAVIVGLYNNKARTLIDAGASIDAGLTFSPRSKVDNPFVFPFRDPSGQNVEDFFLKNPV